MSGHTVPKTAEALKQELLQMMAQFCSKKNPSLTIVFCKEKMLAKSEVEKEWFCNNYCAYHRLPCNLICLDESILADLKEAMK